MRLDRSSFNSIAEFDFPGKEDEQQVNSKLLEERRRWLVEQHNVLLVNAKFRPRIKELESQIDKILRLIP